MEGEAGFSQMSSNQTTQTTIVPDIEPDGKIPPVRSDRPQTYVSDKNLSPSVSSLQLDGGMERIWNGQQFLYKELNDLFSRTAMVEKKNAELELEIALTYSRLEVIALEQAEEIRSISAQLDVLEK